MINTVYELITDVMAKQYPDRVAFRYVAADGKTVVEKTYAQYVQDIRRAVTYFKENIPDIKGKRVGIMSRNCYEYGVNSFGAILAGAVVVTINQKKTWPTIWPLTRGNKEWMPNSALFFRVLFTITAKTWSTAAIRSR